MGQRSDVQRVFVAVDVSESVRREVSGLIDRLARPRDGVKWVSPNEMHLTLCFLGETALNGVPAVCERVARVAAAAEPFTLQICQAGAFPNLGRPRTLWVGVGLGREPLVSLQAEMEATLAELGYRPEARAYTPHLTIGRVRKAGKETGNLPLKLAEARDFDAGGCRVERVTVYSSELTPEGPEHTVLGRAKLGG